MISSPVNANDAQKSKTSSSQHQKMQPHFLSNLLITPLSPPTDGNARALAKHLATSVTMSSSNNKRKRRDRAPAHLEKLPGGDERRHIKQNARLRKLRIDEMERSPEIQDSKHFKAHKNVVLSSGAESTKHLMPPDECKTNGDNVRK